MHYSRILYTLLLVPVAALVATAGEPISIEMQPQVRVQLSVITIGDVARITGGDEEARSRIARLDVADLKPREQGLNVSRVVVEFRLKLAGIDPRSMRFTGSDRTAITPDRRTITSEEVVAAAKAEVMHWLSVPKESVTVELARPVVVKLPEIPASEVFAITAVPHVKPVGLGRVQMHVVLSTVEENLLSFGIDLEVKSLVRTTEPVEQALTPPTLVRSPRTGRIQPLSTPEANASISPLVQAGGSLQANAGPPMQAGMMQPGWAAGQNASHVQTNLVQPAGYSQVQSNTLQSAGQNYPQQGMSQANAGAQYPAPSPVYPIAQASTTQQPVPAAVDTKAVMVRPHQRVTMMVHSGGLNVSAVGEAQQEGRFGQIILVQNVDSKKMVSARVSGSGIVEIDIDK